MNISLKYWLHHRKRALTLLCAIMVSTMAMTVGTFLARSASEASVEEVLTATGNYDLVTTQVTDAQLEALSQTEGIAEYGIVMSGGVCNTQYGTPVPFGAFYDEAAQEIFHYPPMKGGRYPEAPGEICGYRSCFHGLGIAPFVGNTFSLSLYDSQGSFLGEREFTITGILDEEDSFYGERRTLAGQSTTGDGRAFSESDVDFPGMFVCKEDLPDTCAMIAMVLCDEDAIPYASWDVSVACALSQQGIGTWPNSRLDLLSILSSVSVDTERDLLERAHLAYHDFYSSIIIPAFLVLILSVSFISIYVVASGAMKERTRQFGLYRSMGMTLREMRGRLVLEAAFFDFVGVAAGYAIGIVVYLLYLLVANAMDGVTVYNAFGAHPIAQAISMSPYVYPWLFGLLFSALGLAIPVWKATRLSPIEMLSQQKVAAHAKKNRHSRHGRILPKVTGRKLSGSVPISFLIMIVGWAFVFGASFLMAKSDADNSALLEQLDAADSADSDYVAKKDVYSTMCGNVQFNRHNEGISKDDMSALAKSEDVMSLEGVVKLPGLKILDEGDSLTEEQRDALSPLDIRNNEDALLAELYEKTDEQQGYAKDDHCYRVPSVAVDRPFLESLSPYVVSGELDMDGLSDGSKVVVVEYPEGELQNPFSAGDMLTLADTVIEDPTVESHDFSGNVMPEGYEPSFYYDYADKSVTDAPGYSFGHKVAFGTQVCAILRIDSEELARMLSSDSYVFNERRAGYVSPGYGLLCATDALAKWGLPDGCYTDVYVDLSPHANIDRFELLWYSIIGRSGDVETTSRADVKRSIEKTDRVYLVLFSSMIVLVLFAGCFGIVNAYQFAINRNMRNLQVLRAAGMDKRALVLSHLRSLLACPLLAVVTSVVPLVVFDIVRRYATYRAFTLGYNSSILDANGRWVQDWSVRFPWYIELWKQPVVAIMAVAFVCIFALNALSAILPLRNLCRESIIDNIRKDDF